MAELIIAAGKAKPLGKSLKDPMGKPDSIVEEADPADAEADSSEATASLDEAFDAMKSDDKTTFIEATRAAMTAIASDLIAKGG